MELSWDWLPTSLLRGWLHLAAVGDANPKSVRWELWDEVLGPKNNSRIKDSPEMQTKNFQESEHWLTVERPSFSARILPRRMYGSAVVAIYTC
eukprot:scaffold9289_cov101-Cylindrotheca_fusiformis.AAC.1